MTDTAAPAAPIPEPSSAYRWLVLFVISLAMFGNYYIYDSIAPIADILKSDLGFTDENIGSLYSVYSIAAVVILLFGGMLVDKWGTVKSTILFGGICAVAGLLNAVSSELWVMETTAGCALCSSPKPKASVAISAGVIFPSWWATVNNLRPDTRSGAPPSSV